MAKKRSKLLVVDASVMRSPGQGPTNHLASQAAIDVLMAIRAICHRVVVTAAIEVEWDKHQSNFARRWRTTMSQMGKIDPRPNTIDDGIRGSIESLEDKPIKRILLKDVILVEAAQIADGIVISMDDEARRHFQALARTETALRHVVWVNPCQDPKQILEWLKDGAKPRAKYQLFPSRR